MTRLSVEVRGWIVGLLVLQLLTSFVAIGLLGRVSPAVEKILRENVTSLEATEAMLAVLATDPSLMRGSQRARYQAALDRARSNVTEDGEQPLLDELSRLHPSVLIGDEDAREASVRTLVALAEVNRASMREADLAARRLGAAGAWTAVLAGVLGVGLGVLVLNRLIHRLVVPVLRVDVALESVRRGDKLRRCVPLHGPTEIVRIGENLNWILDESERQTPGATSEHGDAVRAALLHVIDQDRRPMVVAGLAGVLAVNAAAYARAEDPSPAAVAEAARLGHDVPGWTLTPVLSGRVWLCTEAAAQGHG